MIREDHLGLDVLSGSEEDLAVHLVSGDLDAHLVLGDRLVLEDRLDSVLAFRFWEVFWEDWH